MNPVEVTTALQIVAQLIPLIQAAVASGQTTIDGAAFDHVVSARNAALAKLDADIAASPA